MVNLVAGRKIVPELMQKEATGERLAEEAAALVQDAGSREEMKRELADVAARLATAEDPIERAARIVNEYLVRGKERNMFRNLCSVLAAVAALAVGCPARAQERRPRIDVEHYINRRGDQPAHADAGREGAGAVHAARRQHSAVEFRAEQRAERVAHRRRNGHARFPRRAPSRISRVRLNFPEPLAKGQADTVTFNYDGKLTGQEDSPVYGIKFASIQNDYALSDVSGALVSGERLHDRPLSRPTCASRSRRDTRCWQRRSERADRGGRQDDLHVSTSTEPSFPGSIAVVKASPQRVVLARRHHEPLLPRPPRTWRTPTARKPARSSTYSHRPVRAAASANLTRRRNRSRRAQRIRRARDHLPVAARDRQAGEPAAAGEPDRAAVVGHAGFAGDAQSPVACRTAWRAMPSCCIWST